MEVDTCESTSEWRGFESRRFYQSGFEFAKTPILILNHQRCGSINWFRSVFNVVCVVNVDSLILLGVVPGLKEGKVFKCHDNIINT